jgi:hypothetical protein
MALWTAWWNAIWLLRPAFSRLRAFQWFATAVAGFTVRTEPLGVTSLVRALKLEARFYNKLVDHFHSPAVKLDRLAALWTQVVLRLFPQPLRINGRCVVVGDGIKIPKRGRKMPAVKLLHQQSESNTKPEYITGHALQAVSLLVEAAASVFAVPLAMRIHEGLVWSNRDRRTLLEKMLALLGIVAIAEPFYFVADAYYAAHKIVTGLLNQNNHLVTRVKSNAAAYTAHRQRGPRRRGRPRVYGRKVKLRSLLEDPKDYRNHVVATHLGQVTVRLPRFRCPGCDAIEAGVGWPSHCRSTPEFDQLQAHFSALMPYRVAAGLLKQVFPIDAGKDPETMRRHTLKIRATLRIDAVTRPEMAAAAIAVTLDSTFIRSCEDGERHLGSAGRQRRNGDRWAAGFRCRCQNRYRRQSPDLPQPRRCRTNQGHGADRLHRRVLRTAAHSR